VKEGVVQSAKCEMRSTYFALCILHVALLLSSCAPKSLTLPTGTSTPLADPTPFSEALDHCDDVVSLTAEIGLSGRAAGQRLRGTLHAGFAPPEALRLEAVAPFGGPFFLLAGKDGRATLLLPRENRVLRDAPASAILEALAGIDQAPSDLRAWIAGCPAATGAASNPRGYGTDWAAADIGNGRQLWIHRLSASQTVGHAGWRLIAVNAGPLTIEFADHTGTQPGRVRIRRASGPGATELDIRLALRQVERGVTLPDTAFTVDVPADAGEITIDELRQSGPLRVNK
jgi:hypothetical protein